MNDMGGGSELAAPSYLGRILTAEGEPIGTCFQTSPGICVTAHHVLSDIGVAEVGASVTIDLLIEAESPHPAEVIKLDSLHDLAVLRRAVPLPTTVAKFSPTDEERSDVRMTVAGHCVVDEAGGQPQPRYLLAVGNWVGHFTRSDSVPLGFLDCKGIFPGMSGAPVRRLSDDAVVGIVSARYNTVDGWGRDSVWVARCEDLATLLEDIAPIAFGDKPLVGPIDVVITVDQEAVTLEGPGVCIKERHRGVTPSLTNAVADLRRGREASPSDSVGSALRAKQISQALYGVGQALAESFFPSPLVEQLSKFLSHAAERDTNIRLGILTSHHENLPWEALLDPLSAKPLILRPDINLYRRGEGRQPTPNPGPLRIVVAISAPIQGLGLTLDYERELRNVIAAVRGARANDATVHLVQFATPAAISRAVQEHRPHILHISAHGAPGIVMLEDDLGNANPVAPQGFAEIVAQNGFAPSVITLSSCHSAASIEDVPSFDQTLMSAGVSAVIGTQGTVTDSYATRLFARVYAELAADQGMEVIEALANARRVVNKELESPADRDRKVGVLGEWTVASVAAGNSEVRLDLSGGVLSTSDVIEHVELPGLQLREVGNFVGRRFELRRLPQILGAENGESVIIYGIGGIGKSTLAGEIVIRVLELNPETLVGMIRGKLGVDQMLAKVSGDLMSYIISHDATNLQHMELLNLSRREDLDWRKRLDSLAKVLEEFPYILVLDEFEANMDPARPESDAITNPELREFLSRWAGRIRRSRLLITSRYAVDLNQKFGPRLHTHQLSPLSLAETEKFVWTLPSLQDLEEQELKGLWQSVGGHPRSLEYVDALLREGQGRWQDVTQRLRDQVVAKIGRQADEWLRQPRSVDEAISESITLAADDVLLTDLLNCLNDSYLQNLLLGMCIYREPVDAMGVMFQLEGTIEQFGEGRDWQSIREDISRLLAEHDLTFDQVDEALRAGNIYDLPDGLVSALQPDLKYAMEALSSSSGARSSVDDLLRRLVNLSLISSDDLAETYFVHRWTASELLERWRHSNAEAIDIANARAAEYWLWRVRAWPQAEYADIHDLLEARYHLLESGPRAKADEIAIDICDALHRLGWWDREESLIRECVAGIPSDSPMIIPWLQRLGVLAHRRGKYSEAQKYYSDVVRLCEAADNSEYMIYSKHQLGMLFHDRGDTLEAARYYKEARELALDPGRETLLAGVHHQMAMMAQEQSDFVQAEQRYSLAREMWQHPEFRPGLAAVNHQLGMLSMDKGEYLQARRFFLNALQIKEGIGAPASLAHSLGQLAVLAQIIGEFTVAGERFEQALDIVTRIGDYVGIATCNQYLGNLACLQGDFAEAERCYAKAVDLSDALDNATGVAFVSGQLGILRSAKLQKSEVLADHLRGLAIANLVNENHRTKGSGAIPMRRSLLWDRFYMPLSSISSEKQATFELLRYSALRLEELERQVFSSVSYIRDYDFPAR
jgi:tetratricopeptide (TPR) repeat protein